MKKRGVIFVQKPMYGLWYYVNKCKNKFVDDDESTRSLGNEHEESTLTKESTDRKLSSTLDEGIAMELYRMFLSNAA